MQIYAKNKHLLIAVITVIVVLSCGLIGVFIWLYKEKKSDKSKAVSITTKPKPKTKPVPKTKYRHYPHESFKNYSKEQPVVSQSTNLMTMKNWRNHPFFETCMPVIMVDNINNKITIDSHKYKIPIKRSHDAPIKRGIALTKLQSFDKNCFMQAVSKYCTSLCNDKFKAGAFNEFNEFVKKYSDASDMSESIAEFQGHYYNFMCSLAPHWENKKYLCEFLTYDSSKYNEWEGDHAYIQYLFPQYFLSKSEPEKYILKNTITRVIDNGGVILFAKLIKVFLFNYACFLIDFKEKNRKNLQTTFDHNKQRISRVLIALKMIGEDILADAFYNFVVEIASDMNFNPKPNKITSLMIWRNYYLNTKRIRCFKDRRLNLSLGKE